MRMLTLEEKRFDYSIALRACEMLKRSTRIGQKRDSWGDEHRDLLALWLFTVGEGIA
jgi:hypothetical protein